MSLGIPISIIIIIIIMIGGKVDMSAGGWAGQEIPAGCLGADVRYCGHPLNHIADYVQLFIGDGDYDDQGYDNVAE